MQISSRFSLAVHILLCVEKFSSEIKVTSDFLAGSANVNPVIIRKLMSQLQDSGLIAVTRGPGGIKLTKDVHDISLFDIYKSVDSVESQMFHFHPNPNVKCPVGNKIHDTLTIHLDKAQKAMETYLMSVYLSDLVNEIKK